MRSTIRIVALLCVAAVPLMAQGPGNAPMRRAPGPPGPGEPGMQAPMGRRPGGSTAQFLLAHTGELDLNDAQVVKLAAIARRAEARRRSMRASADSMRMRFQGPPMAGDSAA